MQNIPRALFHRWPVVLLSLALLPLRAEVAEAEGILTLPKFEVRDSRPTHLVSIPGYEILSLVGPKETAEFANQLQRQTWFLPLLLPPGRRTAPPVPATIILQSRSLAQIKSAQIENSGAGTQPWIMSPAGAGWSSGYPAKTIRVWQADEDTFTVFSEYSANDARDTHSPTLRTEVQATLIWLSENRMLGVPRWYTDELVESLFYLTEITPVQATWQLSRSTGNNQRFPALLFDVLSDLEKGKPWVGRNKIGAFVHWGFWADGGRRREVFLKFIAAADKAPVTETMFREYFGLDSAAVDQALRPFATVRVFEQTHRLRSTDGKPPPRIQPIDVGLATASDVARIMGAAYVAEGAPSPRQAPKRDMLERARTLLSAAYGGGERDPRLLAVFGFLELAAGRPDQAKSYLEMATAAKIVRPRVYLELARIRFGEALSKTATFDQATAAQILEPLLIAQSQLPEMQSTYELMLEIEARRSKPLPPAELEILRENIGRFREPLYTGFLMPARLLGGNQSTSRWTLDRTPKSKPSPERTKLRALIEQLRDNGGKWDQIKFNELK